MVLESKTPLGRLLVFCRGRKVGDLWPGQDGGLFFQYDDGWLRYDGRFPVSLSLPLGPDVFAGGPAHAFFANLLPEGAVRTAVCQRLGISEGNDFALLAAIGGDCAGALSIAPHEPGQREAGYRELVEDELQRWLESWPVLSLAVGEPGVRLSLAGAQDKLPVYLDGDRLMLPLGDAPSSHILKLPGRDFAHLPANECLVTMLAREIGLPAVDASLRSIGDEQVCVVRRYDRALDRDGRLVRLHQEDFCQALGHLPQVKYEQEGGPSFARCFELVSRHCTDPLPATAALLDWLIFGLLAGNADGHAKNLALVWDESGRICLAPFYDLVCTRAYPRLDRRLAMGIGACLDPGQVSGSDWRVLAAELGMGARFLVDRVRAMAEAMPTALDSASKRFRKRFGASPAIQMVAPMIRRQTRRALHLLQR